MRGRGEREDGRARARRVCVYIYVCEGGRGKHDRESLQPESHSHAPKTKSEPLTVALCPTLQSAVLESAAWKYCVPASGRGAGGGGGGGDGEGDGGSADGWLQYRRVVADNYTAEDKNALLEFIFMLKTLAAETGACSALLAPVLARHAHWHTQELVLGTVASFAGKVQVRKKSPERCNRGVVGKANQTDRTLSGPCPTQDMPKAAAYHRGSS